MCFKLFVSYAAYMATQPVLTAWKFCCNCNVLLINYFFPCNIIYWFVMHFYAEPHGVPVSYLQSWLPSVHPSLMSCSSAMYFWRCSLTQPLLHAHTTSATSVSRHFGRMDSSIYALSVRKNLKVSQNWK